MNAVEILLSEKEKAKQAKINYVNNLDNGVERDQKLYDSLNLDYLIIDDYIRSHSEVESVEAIPMGLDFDTQLGQMNSEFTKNPVDPNGPKNTITTEVGNSTYTEERVVGDVQSPEEKVNFYRDCLNQEIAKATNTDIGSWAFEQALKDACTKAVEQENANYMVDQMASGVDVLGEGQVEESKTY